MAVRLFSESSAPQYTKLVLVERKDVVGVKSGAQADDRLRVRGVLQAVNKVNENKRRYGPTIWDTNLSEQSPFMQRLSRHRVTGHLEHPCLSSDDFRVLTMGGWKNFRDIKVGDEVWSRVDGKAVASRVESVVNEPYRGGVFRFKSQAIDSEFTPDHRFLMNHRNDHPGYVGCSGEEFYATARDLEAQQRHFGHDTVPRTAEWEQVGLETITIPPFMGGTWEKFKARQEVPLVLDSKLFAGFLGIYLAEGHCQPCTDHNYNVVISQKTEWSKKYIYDELLGKFPSEIRWKECKTGFVATDARLYYYLSKLGNKYTKRIPREVIDLNAEDLKELIYWYAIGDGRIYQSHNDGNENNDLCDSLRDWYVKPRNEIDAPSFKAAAATLVRAETIPYTRMDLHSVSEWLIRDLHECVVRSGGCATLSKIEPKNDYQFAGRTIRAENKSVLWQLRVLRCSRFAMKVGRTKITPRVHEGNIYCLTTTYGNFYMEQNGKSFWTGNSDGNTMLPLVSHLFERVWREQLGQGNPYEVEPGDYILGEFKILRTPHGQILEELYRAGVDVGVSSRGRGDTQSVDGIEEVIEYALDTWDAVCSPSVDEAHPKMVNTSESKFSISDAVAIRQKLEHAVAHSDDVAEMAEVIAESTTKLGQLKQINETWGVAMVSQVAKNISTLNEKMNAISDSDRVLSESRQSKSISEAGNMDNLAATIDKTRQNKGKAVDRAELDSILSGAGQEINDTNIAALAAALRGKGMNVDEKNAEKKVESAAAAEKKVEVVTASPVAPPKVGAEKPLLRKLTGALAERNSTIEKQNEEILRLRKEVNMGEQNGGRRLVRPGSLSRAEILERIRRRKATSGKKNPIGQARASGPVVGEARERMRARLRERIRANRLAEAGERRVGGLGASEGRVEAADRSAVACAEALQKAKVIHRMLEARVESLRTRLFEERKQRRIAEARLSAAKQYIRERWNKDGGKKVVEESKVADKPVVKATPATKPVENIKPSAVRGRSSLPTITEDSLKRAGQTVEPKAAAPDSFMDAVIKRANET